MNLLKLSDPDAKCVCGRRLFREDKFCGNCGIPVPPRVQETAPPLPSADSRRLDEILDFARGNSPGPSATSYKVIIGILLAALLVSLVVHRPAIPRIGAPFPTASSQVGKVSDADLSGEWQTLDGDGYRMRVQDRHFYLVPVDKTVDGILGCEFSGDGGKYQGTCKTRTIFQWYRADGRLWQSVCPFDAKIEFTNPASTRIAARVETRGASTDWSDQDKDTCGKRIPTRWIDLVLIRPESVSP